MDQRSFGVTALVAVAILLLSLSSCAREQRLVSITLQPSGGFVFEGHQATGQFTAYGSYIHPPETKDITSKVVWSLDIANFADLTETGLITYIRSDGCGHGDVTASFYSDPKNPSAGSVLVASAPVKGANDGTTACNP